MIFRLIRGLFTGMGIKIEKAMVKSNPVEAVDFEIREMEKYLQELHKQASVIGSSKYALETKVERLKKDHAQLVSEIKIAIARGYEEEAKKIAQEIEIKEQQVIDAQAMYDEIKSNSDEGILAYNKAKEDIEKAKQKKSLLVSKMELVKMKNEVAKSKVDFDLYGKNRTGLNTVEKYIEEIDNETKAINEITASTEDKTSKIREILKEEQVAQSVQDIMNRYRTKTEE